MGVYSDFEKALNEELERATSELDRALLPRAKDEHAYQHQSFNLRDNTFSRGYLGLESDYRLVAETEYADFIHNQPWSLGPDPFLDSALRNGEADTDMVLEMALQRALDRFNL